jgi:hypothetical protein
MPEAIPKDCDNCGYEVDEVDELEFCQTCRNAYEAGYQAKSLECDRCGYSPCAGETIDPFCSPENYLSNGKENE